jgi:hypothetical protein
VNVSKPLSHHVNLKVGHFPYLLDFHAIMDIALICTKDGMNTLFCVDGFDEELCSLVDIPPSYHSSYSPKSPYSNRPLELKTSADLMNIDSIDPIHTIVTQIIEVKFKFKLH